LCPRQVRDCEIRFECVCDSGIAYSVPLGSGSLVRFGAKEWRREGRVKRKGEENRPFSKQQHETQFGLNLALIFAEFGLSEWHGNVNEKSKASFSYLSSSLRRISRLCAPDLADIYTRRHSCNIRQQPRQVTCPGDHVTSECADVTRFNYVTVSPLSHISRR